MWDLIMTDVTMQQLLNVLKHILFWVVFAYCYQNAIDVLTEMAFDAHPEHPLTFAWLYVCAFNILSAHLIVKHEKNWPIVSASFISVVAMLVIPLFLTGTYDLLSTSLLVGILISLPLLVFVFIMIKEKLPKN